MAGKSGPKRRGQCEDPAPVTANLDAKNTSSHVVRWEQVILRISGGNRTVAWNEFIRKIRNECSAPFPPLFVRKGGEKKKDLTSRS